MRRSEMAPLADRVVRRAALLGGTHGNELTGVTSIRRRMADTDAAVSASAGAGSQAGGTGSTPRSARPDDATTLLPAPYRPQSFHLDTLIANPGAVAVNRRYVDFDLNRCFSQLLLSDSARAGYEHQRAQVLNRQLGPKGSPDPACEFVIDLHTTTSGLGPTVIIREDDALARIVAAAVGTELPDVRVLSYLAEGDNPGFSEADSPSAGGGPASANMPGDYPYLAEVTPSGIEIEVGPVPQGVIRADVLQWTERIINAILAALDAWNADEPLDIPDELEVYRFVGDLDYPRDPDGSLAGMVHPDLQDQDFRPLQPGDPVFLTLNGSVVRYEGEAGLVPVFVNEAAYYEKRAALTLAERRVISVRPD